MSEERIVQVTRTLEYVGPQSWINTTLERGAVTFLGEKELGEGKTIREVSRNYTIVEEKGGERQ